jgi:hypothetical protein
VRWTPRRNERPAVPLASKPEYAPAALACQMSTAAPLIGVQVAASRTLSRSVSGAPGRPSVMLRRTFSPET